MKISNTTKYRIVFWIRMLFWTLLSCVAPVAVFAYKFGLFKQPVQYDSLGNVIPGAMASLNGWGIVSCIVVGTFLIGIIQEIADACVGYSLTKQCYMGITKLIPLIIAYAVCYFLSGVMAHVMYCLAVIIICKAIAIPINPLPKWKYDKLGIEDYTDALKLLTKIVNPLIKGGKT